MFRVYNGVANKRKCSKKISVQFCLHNFIVVKKFTDALDLMNFKTPHNNNNIAFFPKQVGVG